MLTLQGEISEWSHRNFPGTTREVAALGLGEEVGEVLRAVLKLAQGIRGTKEEWLTEIEKELGDVVIKCYDIAERYDMELEWLVEKRWNDVKKRNWIIDPLKGGQ